VGGVLRGEFALVRGIREVAHRDECSLPDARRETLAGGGVDDLAWCPDAGGRGCLADAARPADRDEGCRTCVEQRRCGTRGAVGAHAAGGGGGFAVGREEYIY